MSGISFVKSLESHSLIEHKTSSDYGSLEDCEVEVIDVEQGKSRSCCVTRGCIVVVQTVTSIISSLAVLLLLGKKVEDLVDLETRIEPYKQFVMPIRWFLNRKCPSREMMVWLEKIDCVIDHYHPFPVELLLSSSSKNKHPEWGIIEKTKKGAYKRLDPKSSQFKQLLKQHGAEKILMIMEQIEAQMHYVRLRKSPLLIKEPLKLIQKALQSGHPFLSRPLVSFSDDTAIPRFQWNINPVSLKNKRAFLFRTSKDELRVTKFPIERRFQNKDEIKRIFDFFKENLPTGYQENGCTYRAQWIVQVLHVLLKYKVDKLRISPPSQVNTFTMCFPFPKVTWRLHEVVVVYMQDDTSWVIDMSIPAPMPFEKWKACLHTPTQGKNLRESFAKNPLFYDGPYGKEIPFAETLIKMHRLYLMQHVAYTE